MTVIFVGIFHTFFFFFLLKSMFYFLFYFNVSKNRFANFVYIYVNITAICQFFFFSTSPECLKKSYSAYFLILFYCTKSLVLSVTHNFLLLNKTNFVRDSPWLEFLIQITIKRAMYIYIFTRDLFSTCKIYWSRVNTA